MERILNFRSPDLCTSFIVTKIKKDFLKKKMSSFKQVVSNYGKEEPMFYCIIKFSDCLNFGYCKYGILFSILIQNGCVCCMHEEKV